MDAKAIRYISALAVLYGIGLSVALALGSDTVKVAVIAIGGTAVGAFAGLIGSVTGARTQAAASDASARLQAETNLRLKQTELDAARENLVLQEQLNWARKAHDALTDLLNQSRELGTTVATYKKWEDIVVKLQGIRSQADLLGANPIVGAEPKLLEELDRYASAITATAYDDWNVSRGEKPSRRGSDWVEAGPLGSALAKDLGQRIRKITVDVFQGPANTSA
jgi:hypothetical protein